MSFMYSATKPGVLRNRAHFERPREKMLNYGPDCLDNVELLAIILGAGIKGRDVLMLANDILEKVVKFYDTLSIDDITAIKGVGTAKACQVMAVVELSRRLAVTEDQRIKDCEDVVVQVSDLIYKNQEYFVTLTLDGAGLLLKRRVVFVGTVNNSLVHPREIFSGAISDSASSIILAHNHPSGIAQPSSDDISVTKRLVEAGELLGIKVLDHIIVSRKGFYSFARDGFMRNKDE